MLFSFGLPVIILFAFIAMAKQNWNSSVGSKENYMIKDTSPVNVQLEKTTVKDMSVLFIADTAKTDEAIKEIFEKDYGELMQFIQQNKLQPLKFMAWHYTTQAPWALDVAIETNQLPAQLSGRIQSRTQTGGEMLIAHVRGAYDQLGQAYAQIEKWMKENNQKAKTTPFEIYINNPFTVKDPSEIRTDIYQPIE